MLLREKLQLGRAAVDLTKPFQRLHNPHLGRRALQGVAEQPVGGGDAPRCPNESVHVLAAVSQAGEKLLIQSCGCHNCS